MKKISLVAIIVLVVLAGIAAYYFATRSKSSVVNNTPSIISFDVAKPNLVLKGTGLVKVEVWAVPTGTGITEANYTLLGTSTLAGTGNDNVQTWNFPIPENPILATEIFARAFDSNGQKVGDKSLPVTGATDIYNALWGPSGSENDITMWDNTRTFSYAVTERFTVKLNGTQYPENNMSVSPAGICGKVSNTPEVNPPDYVKSYEAVKPGKCTIKNNDFSIDVYVYDQNAASQNYNNDQYGFSFSYPQRDILNSDNPYEFVTSNSLVRVDLPTNDFIDTNLGEAAFIVGASKDSQIVTNCLQISTQQEEQRQDPDQTINGIDFKVFEGTGVGAGNIYETKSFRTVVNNTCYEAVLLLHSGNIGNYSPGTVQEFNQVKALSELTDILNTFQIK